MDPQYPIGKFEWTGTCTDADRNHFINQLVEAPAKLRAAVEGLTNQQLDTPYRPGGWTVRQVVHHLPDSHLNAYIRFKLAVTENEPTVKTYEQQLWAELPDGKSAPIEMSLALLDSLHKRFVAFLKTVKPADFARKFRHPELGEVSLEWNLAHYAWHGRHHVAHITSLRARMGW
jgi:DinB family protein